MVGSTNLGEIHRLGVVRLMASSAEDGGIELWRSDAGRVFRVLHLRAMARFASNPGVTTGLFQIKNVTVAGFTDFVASKGNGLGHDFLQSVAPKVAVLAKALGNEEVPENKEEDEARQENGGHAKKVRQVFGLNHSGKRPRYFERSFIFRVCSHQLQGVGHAPL